jgi:hypothetical protein
LHILNPLFSLSIFAALSSVGAGDSVLGGMMPPDDDLHCSCADSPKTVASFS